MSKKPINNRKSLNAYKATLSLTVLQQQIIKGTLLGDSNLRQMGKYSLLRFEQKNKDYLFHLYDTFTDWTITPPQKREQQRLITSEIHSTWFFYTLTHPELQFYKELFYPGGKKILPVKNLDDVLSPVAVAYWYMDDGYKQGPSSSYFISTCSFTLEEHFELIEVFRKKFGISVNIQKCRVYFILYVQKASKQKFKELIEPYIVPSMRYKL